MQRIESMPSSENSHTDLESVPSPASGVRSDDSSDEPWVVGVDPEGEAPGELEMLRWMQRRALMTDSGMRFRRVRFPHDGVFDWITGSDHGALDECEMERSGVILARRSEDGLFALGPHVRTMLDGLEEIAIVVPPTLLAERIDDGGVAVGLSFDDEGQPDRALAEAGSTLAQDLGLPLHFVNVRVQPIPIPILVGPSTLSTPAPAPRSVDDEVVDAALDSLSNWAVRNGFAHASVSVVCRPSIVLGLRDFARERKASMLVVGHDDTSLRLLAPAGARLAGLAERPVAVVPTGEHDA